MGGRGASSGSTISGSNIVKSAKGYQIWNIGDGAPKGYVGLFKEEDGKNKTAYIKSKFSEELANARGININTPNPEKEIKSLQTKINKIRKKQIVPVLKPEIMIKKYENKIKSYQALINVKKELGI